MFSPAHLVIKTTLGTLFCGVLIFVAIYPAETSLVLYKGHFIGSFISCNVLGCIGSYAMGRSERNQFLRWRAEKKMRTELETALLQVHELSGMLPICASCKSVRDDEDYWHSIEAYIAENSDLDLSHTLCPNCAKALYPELQSGTYKEDPPKA